MRSRMWPSHVASRPALDGEGAAAAAKEPPPQKTCPGTTAGLEAHRSRQPPAGAPWHFAGGGVALTSAAFQAPAASLPPVTLRSAAQPGGDAGLRMRLQRRSLRRRGDSPQAHEDTRLPRSLTTELSGFVFRYIVCPSWAVWSMSAAARGPARGRGFVAGTQGAGCF